MGADIVGFWYMETDGIWVQLWHPGIWGDRWQDSMIYGCKCGVPGTLTDVRAYGQCARIPHLHQSMY